MESRKTILDGFHIFTYDSKWVALLGLVAVLFLLSHLGIWTPDIARAQSGGGVDDKKAQRHLELGQEYELAGEWDLAIEEYSVAAQAQSDDLALRAREGINRVLSNKNSFWDQVRRDFEKFLVWLTGSLGKLIVVAILFLLLGRVVVHAIDRQKSWTVIPFFDLTQNDWGQAVSEGIVAHIHETRLLHIHSSEGMLNVSEELDLPSFGASSHKESMLSSLKAMDSLDVSGIGLPVGSVLSAAVRWLDMGQNHISGTIQKQGQVLHLSAQLHRGRGSGINKVWAVQGHIDEGIGPTLFELERELATCILFDVQEEWGASTPTSLMLFTEGLKYFQRFQAYPTVQEENLQKAVRLFEKSLSIDPGYVAAMYNLAIAYHNLGRHQQAIEMLKRLSLQPDHRFELKIAYNLGAAYYHSLLGNWTYDYAEREFSQVVETLSKEDRVEADQELLALAHCGLTSVYAQKIHYETDSLDDLFHLATRHYKEALTIVPENPQIAAVAHTAMGMALLNMKRAEEAVAKFEDAVRLKPDYWRAYIHWGRAEMSAGNPKHAVICLKQAVALNPGYEFAQYQLGVALKNLEKYEEAAEAFSRAPSIAKAHDERGSILAEHCQEYQVALVEFEEAIETKPDLSNAMVNIAWYTLEAGYQDDEHLKRALECARKAVELDEGTPNAWHRHSVLGRVYLAKGQLDGAKRELKEAIQLNKRASQSYFFLAKVHLELGELREAKKALAEFLNRPSRSPWYGKARETAITLIKEISDQLERADDAQ